VPTATPPPSTATPAPEGPGLKIECIFYDGLVPTSEADGYVQIVNSAPESMDLAGWRLQDVADGTPTFSFPAFTLASGDRVRVYTNQVHEEWGGLSFGRGTSIWNNSDPDIAALFDPQGNQVSVLSYPPGCE
jgi:hypothetical protein